MALMGRFRPLASAARVILISTSIQVICLSIIQTRHIAFTTILLELWESTTGNTAFTSPLCKRTKMQKRSLTEVLVIILIRTHSISRRVLSAVRILVRGMALRTYLQAITTLSLSLTKTKNTTTVIRSSNRMYKTTGA